MSQGANAFGDHVSCRKQIVIMLFSHLVQRLEKRANDIPVINVTGNRQLVG